MTNYIDTAGKTFQQVSDEIAGRLVQQGKRCVLTEGGDTCAYADTEGNHCAVGWLLDPEDTELLDLEADVEALLVHIETSDILQPNLDFITTHKNKLQVIQALHDNAYNASLSKEMIKEGIQEEQDEDTRIELMNLNFDAWNAWLDLPHGNPYE